MFYPRLEVAGFKLGSEVFGATMADIIISNRNRR